MQLYAYADETIFKINQEEKDESLGCGIFITDTEISQTVIDNALLRLTNIIASDPTKVLRNDKLLKNRFFHACVDSYDAKDCLCSVINEEIKGVFCVAYFDNLDKKSTIKIKEKESLFERCLTDSSLEFFNSMQKVNLVIERRDSLTKGMVENWKDLIYNIFEISSYRLPDFITYFPEISITLGDKTIPGLQVVDFLLWAKNRTKYNPPDDNWFKKLKVNFSHHSNPDSSGNNTGQYFLNGFEPRPWINYPLPLKRIETNDQLIDAYILIETLLRNLQDDDFDDFNLHLRRDSHSIQKLLLDKSYSLNANDIIKTGQTFIRIFDSLPIYKNIADQDVDTWERLLFAKHLASLFLTIGFMHTERTRSFILRWRHQAQMKNQLEMIMATKI